eukprot:5275753-Amphidinium_carterae.1
MGIFDERDDLSMHMLGDAAVHAASQLCYVGLQLLAAALIAKVRLYTLMAGMHGAAYANFAIQNADCIVAIGSRFDDRTTGTVHATTAQE